MKFEYRKHIDISVSFFAPLLGADITNAYKPRLEDAIREVLLTSIREGQFDITNQNDWQIKIEIHVSKIRAADSEEKK